MFGLTTSRRLRAELAAAKAETDRQRERADKAEANERAFRTAATTAAEQVIDISIVNDCLTHDLLTSRRQRVIARKAAARILAAWSREKKRADRLQQRLDDACGLNYPSVEAGAGWQQRREDKRNRVKEATP